MRSQRNSRRSYGTGSLQIRGTRWYGQWWIGGRQVRRVIGPKRQPGSREGLTRTQAERELRRVMQEVRQAPAQGRVTVGEAGERYLRHLEAMGRKKSTRMDYESYFRVHLRPWFGNTALERVKREDVENFMAAKAGEGLRPKSVLNFVGLLHGIFAFAEKRGWAAGNPVKLVDKPRADDGNAEIRFLDQVELDALVDSVPDDDLGHVERVMYLTAAMTGLRQGELLALRWRDVDWSAGRIRVRRNFVRGEYGTPKSRRSSRSVPLADRVGGELDRHFQRSRYQADDDLVFAHPETGKPIDRSKLLKRFKAALRRGGVRQVRFHDLRHTFGTRMAAAGVAMRTLQEFMGHRDFATTLRYADYAPNPADLELVQKAFGTKFGTKLNASRSETGSLPVREQPTSDLDGTA